MCGGCGGVCVWSRGGTVNIIFLVTYARHQQPLFSLKNISGIPGALLRHFIEYAILRGLVVLPLYGARGEALWQKMVLGHSKGLK